MNLIQTYSFLAIVALTLTAFYGFQYESSQQILQPESDNEILEQYNQWKQKYGKNKLESTFDDFRFNTFKNNLKQIYAINQENIIKGLSLRLGQGPYTDLTLEEFTQSYDENFRNLEENDDKNMIDSEQLQQILEQKEQKQNLQQRGPIDWRKRGAVSPVQDQKLCGGCWAYAAKGALEGLDKIQNGRLRVFSSQMFIDCSAKNLGCDGGWPGPAFEFSKYYGVILDRDYPFTSGADGYARPCQYKQKTPVFQNSGYYVMQNPDFSDIHAVLSNQPVAIKMNGGSYLMQHYEGGLIEYGTGCGSKLGHSVLLVGYDIEKRGGYWIIKNSWGTGWGERGYVHVQAMVSGVGTCGSQRYMAWPY